MTPLEAEQLINKYGEALARGTEGGLARKISWLPCSIGRLRWAFYVYLHSLIEAKALTQSAGDALKSAYQSLSHFLDDKGADEINQLHRTRTRNARYLEFLRSFHDSNALGEINSYINECFGQWDKQDHFLVPEVKTDSSSRVEG